MRDDRPAIAGHVRRHLDHLVLPVGDLATARARLSRIGFTVAADALHPFGTENACVFFADKTYLEPLAVAVREDCEAAALTGNVFVARDQAYRFRRGQDGFSALVFSTDDAAADHLRFQGSGLSGGDILEFSRPMKRPDGSEAIGQFRLAFASDLRAPDLFCFTCQRVQPLPSDRSTLENHANGVTGIRKVILSEPNPTDFQYVLQQVVDARETEAHSFGMDIETENAQISVLNEAGMRAYLGVEEALPERGLRARAIVFTVDDLAATQAALAENAIDHIKRGDTLLVPPAPGQGAIFVFGE
ncbi:MULTISPECIES: VOC family protein [unclassified Rhizobium]|uniref:VOC family protein n=1 Tax=unclassified Rhizobium TaxID=2613769 RepID=UPI0007145998|nr:MULTISPECIES: VOC family protein [unclassified Rhizobium]KQR67956.1 lactoylglutathione lyase [Rhizobium sp. Leaf341]KQS74476.1 lactoylglutathione lyase [Rhizobium sp. Leaf383]